MSNARPETPHALSDRYELERELGRGGSAVVYLASDRKLGKEVALKLLLPEVATAVNVTRFLREIQIAARLVHPHIVQLFDSGLVEQLPFYVMTFIDGQALRARLGRESQLPLGDALRIASEVADALDYAHAVGVAHRDIKPENLLLASSHTIVADFGIAKAITAAASADRSPSDNITEPNFIIGTPAYMSPEQWFGDGGVDGRSDIYSLGVTLYEMLSGSLPFPGATAQEILRKKLTEEPPSLRSVRSDIPPAVCAAVSRALAREPDDRFATAGEFAQALVGSGTSPSSLIPSPVESEYSIVVLPLAVWPRGADNEILADGMTEDIINALMKLRTLRVVPRTSTFALKDKYEDVREIGRRLKVRVLFEGSIKWTGDRMRVSAKLINVADGFQLWYGEFDRDPEDAIALPDDLARAVNQRLQPAVAGVETPTRHTPSKEVYDLYTRGRFFWNHRSPVTIGKAEECFRRAIERDPEFALPYAGQADLHTVLFIYGYVAPLEAFARARDAAMRALALDPAAAEPHTALGAVRAILEWDWDDAIAEFRRAVALNPQYPQAYQWLANYVLIPLGRLDEALRELRRAKRIDEFSHVINMSIGMTLFYARRYEEAEAELRSAIELDPNYMVAHYFLGRCLSTRGRYAEGLEALRIALTLSGGNPFPTAEIGYVHALEGDRRGAESALNMLRAQASQRYVSNCLAAQIHAALGNATEAFAFLEKGVEERAPDAIWLGVNPAFDPLRGDPRFAALLARIGLPQ